MMSVNTGITEFNEIAFWLFVTISLREIVVCYHDLSKVESVIAVDAAC